jgi:hypothetical protein
MGARATIVAAIAPVVLAISTWVLIPPFPAPPGVLVGDKRSVVPLP